VVARNHLEQGRILVRRGMWGCMIIPRRVSRGRKSTICISRLICLSHPSGFGNLQLGVVLTQGMRVRESITKIGYCGYCNE